MGAPRFLEAGNVLDVTTVRPNIAATAKKGLGQVEADADDVFETSDGQFFPKDEVERDAETAGIMDVVEEEDLAEPVEGVEESPVRAKKAPKEPTELERLRHEATHLPYRSWCEYCIKGRGRFRPHLRKGEADEEGAVPNISFYYFFVALYYFPPSFSEV